MRFRRPLQPMARNPDPNAFQQIVTLAMVAEAAGVSPSTVSRILTGHAIEDALVGTGIVPLFVSGHWNVQDEVEPMTHLLGRRVDGVIVLTGRLSDEQIRDYAQRVPIVVT